MRPAPDQPGCSAPRRDCARIAWFASWPKCSRWERANSQSAPEPAPMAFSIHYWCEMRNTIIPTSDERAMKATTLLQTSSKVGDSRRLTASRSADPRKPHVDDRGFPLTSDMKSSRAQVPPPSDLNGDTQ